MDTKKNKGKYNGDTKAKYLTKREYFAGLAMQGFMANSHLQKDLMDEVPDPTDMRGVVARTSVRIADSLLDALEDEWI